MTNVDAEGLLGEGYAKAVAGRLDGEELALNSEAT
jgi:hypothetical protein